MALYRDQSGVPDTCPKIDDVISFLDSVDWKDESLDMHRDYEECKSIMEEIRKSNQNLREWGNLCVRERNEFESKIDELENEISKLQSEVKYLERVLH